MQAEHWAIFLVVAGSVGPSAQVRVRGVSCGLCGTFVVLVSEKCSPKVLIKCFWNCMWTMVAGCDLPILSEVGLRALASGCQSVFGLILRL